MNSVSQRQTVKKVPVKSGRMSTNLGFGGFGELPVTNTLAYTQRLESSVSVGEGFTIERKEYLTDKEIEEKAERELCEALELRDISVYTSLPQTSSKL